MTYTQTCPRCGLDLSGEVPGDVADAVVAHARDEHGHGLDRDVVLAHLAGIRPDDWEG